MEGKHRLLNIGEASEYTRLSTPTLYRYCAQGKIPHVRLSGRLLFDIVALDEWIRQRSFSAQVAETRDQRR